MTSQRVDLCVLLAATAQVLDTAGELPAVSVTLHPDGGTIELRGPESLLPLATRRAAVDRLAETWGVVPDAKDIGNGWISFSARQPRPANDPVSVFAFATSHPIQPRQAPTRITTTATTADLARGLEPWAATLDTRLVSTLILHDELNRHHVQLIANSTNDPRATMRALSTDLPLEFDPQRHIGRALLPTGHHLHITAPGPWS